MNTLQVGVLLPTSTVIPLGKSFRYGLKKAFSENSDINIELTYEFIGNGSPNLIQEKARKLVEFDDIDVLVGVISNYALMYSRHFFESLNIPVLVNNLGAHVPYKEKLPNNAIINSDHLWLQAWALGHWAVNTFGKKGMVAGGVYDMAYSFAHMLDLGMTEANQEAKWSFAVSRMPQGEDNLSDPTVVLDYVEKEQPDFLCAFFCGEEANMFLQEFVRRKLNEKIPLIGFPYLFQSASQLKLDLNVFSSTLNFGKEHLKGSSFITGLDSGPFSILGYETAQWLYEFAKEKDKYPIQARSKRGKHTFDMNRLSGQGQVELLKCEFKSSGNELIKHDELLRIIPFDEKSIQKSAVDVTSAWFNPYLSL